MTKVWFREVVLALSIFAIVCLFSLQGVTHAQEEFYFNNFDNQTEKDASNAEVDKTYGFDEQYRSVESVNNDTSQATDDQYRSVDSVSGGGSPVSCGQPGANPATCIPTGESTTIGGDPSSSNIKNVGGDPSSSNIKNVGGDPSSSNKNNVGSGGIGRISNPITSKSLDEFILKIIDVLLVFAVPLIVFYIMYAGYLFVTAGGEEAQISKARTALLYAVVGGVIVLGAKLIITVIQGTIKAF